MSLILDALNRSRGEQDQVPTLGTRHDYRDSDPPGGSRVLAVVLVLALMAIAWLLWDRFSGSVQPATAPVPALAPAGQGSPPLEPSRPPVPEPAEQAIQSPPPATAASSEPAQLDQPVAPAAAPAPAPKARRTASADVSALYDPPPSGAEQLEPPEKVEQASAQAAVSSAPVEEETGVDIEQLVRQAENELENARLAEHPAPFISELSQQVKDAIPTIFYERHDYSGRAGQSLVVLNGKELRVGGSPASGVRVEEILPDSVVLNYRGTEFRLRALNSWVNL